jgi:cell division protease FtsH
MNLIFLLILNISLLNSYESFFYKNNYVTIQKKIKLTNKKMIDDINNNNNIFEEDDNFYSDELIEKILEKNDNKQTCKNQNSIPHTRNINKLKSIEEKTNNGDFSKIETDANFKLVDVRNYNFNNIGGYDDIKEQLLFDADILINYQNYIKYDVKVPKGVALVGPPGTGKTLFAKALSGEINSSFIAVSGSQFQEIYVGVGQKRVRELFELAKKNTPCIIFIDEVDSIGRARSDSGAKAESERDNTLNQLLMELDGFNEIKGIYLIVATNRPDLLDPALMRPGRIDRTICIDIPNENSREKILDIYIKNKPHDSNVIAKNIAQKTIGLSGAQLSHIINEAMLLSIKHKTYKLSKNEIDLMIVREYTGFTSMPKMYSSDAKLVIAFHELGHAIVGLLLKEHIDPQQIYFSEYSPDIGGITVFEEETFKKINTQNELLAQIAVLLGGKIAEEEFFGIASTGASSDLAKAKNLAIIMVTEYGFGSKNIYTGISEANKIAMDEDIENIINEGKKKASLIIKKYRSSFTNLAHILVKQNSLTKIEIINEFKKRYGSLSDIIEYF